MPRSRRSSTCTAAAALRSCGSRPPSRETRRPRTTPSRRGSRSRSGIVAGTAATDRSRPGSGERPGPAPAEVTELRALVAKLPERQRLAVFLRYYADLDYAAIGTALGIRTGTVSATLAAGIRSLRRMAEEVEL